MYDQKRTYRRSLSGSAYKTLSMEPYTLWAIGSVLASNLNRHDQRAYPVSSIYWCWGFRLLVGPLRSILSITEISAGGFAEEQRGLTPPNYL